MFSNFSKLFMSVNKILSQGPVKGPLDALAQALVGVSECSDKSSGTWKQNKLKGGCPSSDGGGRGGSVCSEDRRGKKGAALSAEIILSSSSASFTIATSSVAVLTAIISESLEERVSSLKSLEKWRASSELQISDKIVLLLRAAKPSQRE